MPVFEGRVTIVQESRFQAIDDHGVAQLFLLSPRAAAEPGQLASLAKTQARVRVRFSSADNVIGYLAHCIDVRDEGAARVRKEISS